MFFCKHFFRTFFHICFSLIVLFQKANAYKTQSMALEDIWNGMILPGSVISNKTLTSYTKCAIECNRNEECRSINFCEGELCQLNKEDVFSTAQNENILQANYACKYIGMRRQSKPICQIEGVFVDNRSASQPPGCVIQVKLGPQFFSQIYTEHQTRPCTQIRSPPSSRRVKFFFFS